MKQKKNFLADVPADKVFWVFNGGTLKNLEELAVALKEITVDQFNYHVNKEKNDFANWVNDVIADSALANQLRKLKTKMGAFKAVKARIAKMKK